MSKKPKIANDGRLLCSDCDNIELEYNILHHRKDVHYIRYNADTHEAYIVEKPVDGDTLEVYDEYLHCPKCKCQHDMPTDDHDEWPLIGNMTHEGDFLRKNRPDLPIYKCPRCGATATAVVETFDTMRYVNYGYENGVSVFDTHEILEHTGQDKHLYCCKCRASWSAPHNMTISVEKNPA